VQYPIALLAEVLDKRRFIEKTSYSVWQIGLAGSKEGRRREG